MSKQIKIASVEMMRKLDLRATSEHDIPPALLMENAAAAIHSLIQQQYGIEGRKISIFCGAGNNGGDGFALGRMCRASRAKLSVFLLGNERSFSPETRANYCMLRRAGQLVVVNPSLDVVAGDLKSAEIVVDAIFGTGLSRDLDGRFVDIIGAINAARPTVIAIDIPSGASGDNGSIHGAIVNADHAVALGLPKPGNLLYPAAGHVGKLWHSAISFPPQLQDSAEIQTFLAMPPRLRRRPPDGHKNSFGSALIIGGCQFYRGAPALAALSFLRSGAGYARLAVPAGIASEVAAIAIEAVLCPQGEPESLHIDLVSANGLLQESERSSVVVVGMGLGQEEETRQTIENIVPSFAQTLILDGDGLTLAGTNHNRVLKKRADRGRETILTPHLGEMAQLSRCTVAEIKSDPIAQSRQLASELGATIVLKGPHSLVASPDGKVFINPSGNSGMATAGSGDVLSGTVAAARVHSSSTLDAARIGVFIHGLAGDMAASALGEDGLIASDLIHQLPAAFRKYRNCYEELAVNIYDSCRKI